MDGSVKNSLTPRNGTPLTEVSLSARRSRNLRRRLYFTNRLGMGVTRQRPADETKDRWATP